MADEIPVGELRDLLRYEPETGKLFWRERGHEFVAAFGKALAAEGYKIIREEPPVDPLLLEAREICAIDCTGVTRAYDKPDPADMFRDGSMDSTNTVQRVLQALKRGIELAKSGAA
jgi:hypothetical protein